MWLVSLLACAGAIAGDASPKKKQVLLVHSFGHNNKYTQLQEIGFREALATPDENRIQLRVEFMDVTSSGDFQQQLDSHSESFRSKKQIAQPDLVVTTDTPALQWALSQRAEFFPDASIVFSAAVAGKVAIDQFHENTGVLENVDVRGTIELIQKLHPHMTRLVIVRDKLGHSLKLEQLVQTSLAHMNPVPIVDWKIGLGAQDLLDCVKSLTPESPVLLLSHHPSLTQEMGAAAISFEKIASQSGSAIYALYDAYMGRGIVGGRLASGEVSGHRAGLMARRILFDGEKASNIPILPSATVYMFDGRQLDRWGIDETTLPPGSIVQFRSKSFLAVYRWYLVGGSLIVFTQAFIIFLLVRNINTRKRAEHDLRESRRQWQTVFEDAPVGIATAALDGHILDANPMMEKTLGYTRDELRNLTIADLTHPEDHPKSMEAREYVLAHPGEMYSFEKRYIRKDGTIVWCSLTIAAIRDVKQNVSYFIGATQDITDRKKVHEAIERHSGLRESIINTAAEGICLWHAIEEFPYCRFVIWNKRMTEITGYTIDEINRLGWFQSLYERSEHEQVHRAMIGSLNGEHFRQRERVIKCKDGKRRTISLSTSNVAGEDGRKSVVAVMQDVTERYLMEDALRRSERHYRLITESMEDIISLHTLDGRYLYASSSMHKATGFSPEEVVGRDAYEFIHPDDHSRVRTESHDPVLQGQPRYVECRMLLKNGSYQWMQTRTSLVRNANGEPEALLCCTRDITSRKQAEDKVVSYAKQLESINHALVQQKDEANALNKELKLLAADLEKANNESQAANRSKSEFLANMSHEIRTPMTAILGFADNLLDEGLPTKEKSHAIETIRRNGEHLLNIINDILDVSKIEAGRMRLEKVPCHIATLVQETFSLMKARADAKGLQASLQFASAMPSTIVTDPLRLRQILINLLGNAIKFTESGSVNFIISMLEGEPTRLCMDVIDTGIGMTESQSEVIFQAFAQADTSMTRKFGGTGLGLVISVRLADLLGGKLALLNTKPGQGTTFRLLLPAEAAASPTEWIEPVSIAPVTPERTTSAAKTSFENALSGLRVLVADDSQDNQRLVEHILRLSGALVTVVENGQQALEAALAADEKHEPYQAILMDMQMPVMDGYAATRKLRERGYQWPIIALTAHAMVEDRAKCLGAGCDEYATKPIKRQEIINLIAKLAETVPSS